MTAVSKWYLRSSIESIKRPIHHIALQGVITTVHNNSGLIKRCNNCKSIVYDSCANNCDSGWSWDLRVSCRLYDGTGSMRVSKLPYEGIVVVRNLDGRAKLSMS
jgi:hypothetical protein